MSGNSFKIALRILLKQKAYTFINIAGLSVGIAASILIFLYVRFEYSFENFHKDVDRIYRLSITPLRQGVSEGESPVFTAPAGPQLLGEFPEVENYTRFSVPHVYYFYYSGNIVKIDGVRYADSTFFSMFSFDLVRGSRKAPLATPYSIMLTEETAVKLFGNSDPLGKVIRIDNKNEYAVTGIVKTLPQNSDIQFNALVSFSTLYHEPNYFMDWNGGNQYYTFIKMKEKTDPVLLSEKFPSFMYKHINEQLESVGIKFQLKMRPFKETHLYYNENNDTILTNIRIFSTIAILILIVACINFINLSTAGAAKRYKEVGVKKVLGAGRKSLIVQFLLESLIISFVATVTALILVELLMPVYNNLIERDLSFGSSFNLNNLIYISAVFILTGLAAGLYPAFYLSGFEPVRTLKGITGTGKSRPLLRNSLVIFQFSVSIALIICTLLTNRQMSFVKNRNLGFNKENVLVLPLLTGDIQSKYNMIKDEIGKITGVRSVTASSDVPLNGFTSNGYIPEGFTTPLMIHVLDADPDFLKTFDISVLAGRNFSSAFETDKDAYIINETLAKTLGWKDPLDKTINRNGSHKIIGIIKDFNYASLHSRIEPLIIAGKPQRGRFDNLSVRFDGGNIPLLMDKVKAVWQSVSPSTPFDFYFLDKEFDSLYKYEQKFSSIFLSFSVLAIIIALLGLFSLSSYSAGQRTKEIGIRKVLGATPAGISGLLFRDYLILVLVANILAWPAAYLFMEKILENFAYRISPDVWTFAFAGIIAIAVAFMTVLYHALRLASSDPVKSLRYE